MKVGQLKKMIEFVPDTHEVVVMFRGQTDIFTTVDCAYQGEYKPWQESEFDCLVGEVVDSKIKNCLVITKLKKEG